MGTALSGSPLSFVLSYYPHRHAAVSRYFSDALRGVSNLFRAPLRLGAEAEPVLLSVLSFPFGSTFHALRCMIRSFYALKCILRA